VVTVRIRAKALADLNHQDQAESNAGQIGQRARVVTMDPVARLSTDWVSRSGLGRGQIECQSVLSRQPIITIEMKQIKARQQALKQFHE